MDYKYDVTLSFAGEDRKYVDEVAEILKANDVKVFYDKFEEADLWGKDLGLHFNHVYTKSAKYCIPFISKHYKEKIWTNYELRNIICRAIENNEEYILPAKFDTTEIEGIRSTIGFIDLRNKTPEQLAKLIIQKLGREVTLPITQEFQEKRSDVLFLNINNSFYHTGIAGISSAGVSIDISIINTIAEGYRYFYEPVIRLTHPYEGNDSFQLIDPNQKIKFPVKIEYGEQVRVTYNLARAQQKMWNALDPNCEIFAVCSTTVGEKFESNKRQSKDVSEAFKIATLYNKD